MTANAPAEGPRLVALVGPTAAGKTAAAIALAEALGGEIVSCDSLAVYRECDVGTAKPSPDERARVAHHLVDVADPAEPFSAARFVDEADRAALGIAARGRAVIVAGGTGLYLHALVDGLFPSPPADGAWRAALRAESARVGWPALHARLQAVDPVAAARIAPTDPVRIERALEVHAQTGEAMSALQERHRAATPARYRTLTVIVDPGVAELDRRIAVRVEAMLAGGLREETARLVERHGRALKVLGAVGYKEALACHDGQLASAALGDAIRTSTRRFARRQRNWFARYERPGRRAAVLPVADGAAVARGAVLDEIRRFLDGP